MRIIDVISHPNVAPDELAFREPPQGDGDFRFGSQVIVGASQVAFFERRGKILDALETGAHTLSVANLPILSGLIGLATSGRTPFTANVYFVNLRDMPSVGWGTNPPIPLETPGKGMGAVLLSTHGTMNLRISDAERFLVKFAANQAVVRLDSIKDAIQTKLLGELTVLLMSSGADSVMAANKLLNELEGGVLAKLSQQFEDEFGIAITALDANPFRAKEASIEELMNYVSPEAYDRMKRWKIAETAAGNTGAGGALVGAGLGLGVGQGLGSAFSTPEQQQQQQMLMMQQQMMMQKMMEMMNQGQQPAAPQAAPATPAAPSTPTSKAEVDALLDALEMRFINGEISEDAYNRLVAKWQERRDQLPG